MAELYEIKEEVEKVILVAVASDENSDDKTDVLASLDELGELVRTAGAVTVGKMIQNREQVHHGTYIGSGKTEELLNMIKMLGATGIVCDDELSPAQLKNLSAMLQVKVMDRTMLILDIFAKHAQTKEGKIQVELAQLKYRSTRLVGMHDALSRLGGGIGTRGPGEKKLEIDRRLIRDRISQLNKELKGVVKTREIARGLRNSNAIPTVAIVGYTNAGKSTLLNYLTKANVLEENKLFATLDPTTRVLELESGQRLLMTDTVGFIRKLPHNLVDAFKSTLEEAKYADIIIHVVDASNRDCDMQMHIVYETLRQLEIKDKTIITVFNKIDILDEDRIFKDLKADKTIKASAKTGEGIRELLNIIEELLKERKVYVERTYSYDDAGKVQNIRKYGQLLSEEYTSDGIKIKAYIPKEYV